MARAALGRIMSNEKSVAGTVAETLRNLQKSTCDENSFVT
jgi:hypothetical protein